MLAAICSASPCHYRHRAFEADISFVCLTKALGKGLDPASNVLF